VLLKLKMQIYRDPGSQIVAAKRLSISEARLSKIIHEHVTPTASERAKLVAAFGAGALKADRRTSNDSGTMSEVANG